MSSMKPIATNKNYGITRDGRVYSYRRKIYLQAADNGLGYKFVRIGSKIQYVHRLVAETFIPCPAGAIEVNHKDKNKGNNRASNLEWVTKSQNGHHAHGTLDAQERFNSYIDAGAEPDMALYTLT